MGVSIQQWRAAIGCFVQPAKSKSVSMYLMVSFKGISLSIRVVLFLLLIVNGLESNPGPFSRNNQKSSAASSGVGMPTGKGSRKASVSCASINSQENTHHTTIRRSQRTNPNQSEIRSWLQTTSTANIAPNPSQNNPTNDNSSIFEHDTDRDTEFSDQDDDDDKDDTRSILLDIRRSVKVMNSKFDKLERSVDDIKRENKRLREQNETLNNRIDNIEQTLMEQSLKTEQIEAQSRRDNLKFYNITDKELETWEESEKKVRDYIDNELQMDSSKIDIERAHRLPSRDKKRPIIVKFSRYKDKDNVLRAYREKMKTDSHSGTKEPADQIPIRVSEDFPARVGKMRSKLIPFLRESINNKKSAFLKYDKLVVEGKVYAYDEASEQPILVPKQ